MSNYKKVNKDSDAVKKLQKILLDCNKKSVQYFRTIKNVARRNPAITGKSTDDIIDNAYPNDSEHTIMVITSKDIQNIIDLFATLYELVEDDSEGKE